MSGFEAPGENNCTNYIELLIDFHRKYGHYEFFGMQVDEEIIELRKKLIHEEVNEELLPVLEKLKTVNSLEEWQNLQIELADALADSLYVIFGTCVSMGIPIDEVFEEVHRSNMTKSMEKDTKAIKGKTIKGPNYDPPNLRKIILEAFK